MRRLLGLSFALRARWLWNVFSIGRCGCAHVADARGVDWCAEHQFAWRLVCRRMWCGSVCPQELLELLLPCRVADVCLPHDGAQVAHEALAQSVCAWPIRSDADMCDAKAVDEVFEEVSVERRSVVALDLGRDAEHCEDLVEHWQDVVGGCRGDLADHRVSRTLVDHDE